MKFQTLYPNAVTGEWAEPCLVKNNALLSCDLGMGGCGEYTRWRDTSYGIELPCCSQECLKTMDDVCAFALAKLGVEKITFKPIESGTADAESQQLSSKAASAIAAAFQIRPEDLLGAVEPEAVLGQEAAAADPAVVGDAGASQLSTDPQTLDSEP